MQMSVQQRHPQQHAGICLLDRPKELVYGREKNWNQPKPITASTITFVHKGLQATGIEALQKWPNRFAFWSEFCKVKTKKKSW